MSRRFVLLVFLYSIIIICKVTVGVEKLSVLKAHEWARLTKHENIKLTESTQNPQTEPTEENQTERSEKNSSKSEDDKAALLFLKKFIDNLFNRSKLVLQKNGEIYERLLLFKLLPSELENLENFNDPRDLDNVLEKIFEKVETMKISDELDIIYRIWNMIKEYLTLLQISELRFILVALLGICLGWYIKRSYNFSTLVLLIGGCALIGYIITYMECNRKFQVDEMIELLEETEVNRPSWFGNLQKALFGTDPAIEHKKEQIRKANKIKLPYCRPDHVLIIYLNDLFAKQLQFLMEQCTLAMMSLNSNLSLPVKIVSSCLLVYLVAFVTRLVFENIFKTFIVAWFQNHKPNGETTNKTQSERTTEDCLTGTNLTLFLHTMQKLQACSSGMEELQKEFDFPIKTLKAVKDSSRSNTPDSSSEQEANEPNTNSDAISNQVNDENHTNI